VRRAWPVGETSGGRRIIVSKIRNDESKTLKRMEDTMWRKHRKKQREATR
jgi:hypothetical protein